MSHPLAWGRRLAGDECGQRLAELAGRLERRGLFFGVATTLAHHEHAVGVRIGFEVPQGVDEAGAVDRIPADADAGALADLQVRELPDRLVGQRPRSTDDADPARLMDITRHDTDLALTRSDDA